MIFYNTILFVFFIKPIIDGFTETQIFSGLNLSKIVGGLFPLLWIFPILLKQVRIKQSKFNNIFFIWVIYNILISIIRIIFNVNAFDGLIRSINGVGLFFVVPQFVDNFKKLKKFNKIWIWGSIFTAITGVWYLLSGQYSRVGPRISYKTGTPSLSGIYHESRTFGMHLLIIIPLLFFESIFAKKKQNKTILWGLILVYSLLIYYAVVRSLYIALFAYFIILAFQKKKKWLLIVLAIFMISNFPLLYRAFTTKGVENLSDPLAGGGRRVMLESAYDVFQKANILEKIIGPGGWGRGASHSGYFQILVELGILGVLIFGVMLIKIFQIIKIRWKQAESSIQKNIVLVFFLIYLYMIIESFTSSPFESPNFQWIFWSYLGILLFNFSKFRDEVVK